MDSAVETTKNARRRSRSETEARAAAYAEAESARLTPRLAQALRSLGDRDELNANPLARVEYIQRLAADKYGDKIMPRGLALRHVVTHCIGKICAELGDEPGLASACRYLDLRSRGFTCRQISLELGLAREHVSRTVRKKALGLLIREFVKTVESNH